MQQNFHIKSEISASIAAVPENNALPCQLDDVPEFAQVTASPPVPGLALTLPPLPYSCGREGGGVAMFKQLAAFLDGRHTSLSLGKVFIIGAERLAPQQRCHPPLPC